jgi:hypothetical protein
LIASAFPHKKKLSRSFVFAQISSVHSVHRTPPCHGSVTKNDHGISALSIPGSSNVLT